MMNIQTAGHSFYEKWAPVFLSEWETDDISYYRAYVKELADGASWMGSRVLFPACGSALAAFIAAAMFPEIQVTVLDSDPRRLEQTKKQYDQTSLNNITFVSDSIEDYEPEELFTSIISENFVVDYRWNSRPELPVCDASDRTVRDVIDDWTSIYHKPVSLFARLLTEDGVLLQIENMADDEEFMGWMAALTNGGFENDFLQRGYGAFPGSEGDEIPSCFVMRSVHRKPSFIADAITDIWLQNFMETFPSEKKYTGLAAQVIIEYFMYEQEDGFLLRSTMAEDSLPAFGTTCGWLYGTEKVFVQYLFRRDEKTSPDQRPYCELTVCTDDAMIRQAREEVAAHKTRVIQDSRFSENYSYGNGRII